MKHNHTSAPLLNLFSLAWPENTQDVSVCRAQAPLAKRLLSLALCITLPCMQVSPALAQIVANPSAPTNTQATVLKTANGLPQVNIQTPNEAGVSMNNYAQFNVSANGAILNNSVNNVSTQTAGWVTGNPWLANGAAKVIVNQVVSSNPSLLNGYIEVAGQKADVVIANPSGIAVNGSGFINAGGVTLSTGQLQFSNNGALAGSHVQGGTISIGGAGLNNGGADYTALISRALEVNAGVWANQLSVTTGVNQVAYGFNGAVASNTAAGTAGTAPPVAIDVALLGGMYANKIFLVGTESGVGVSNSGVISSTGELTLSQNGWLQNAGQIQSASNLAIATTGSAGSLRNTGVINSTSALQIQTSSDLANTGALLATGNTRITSGGQVSNIRTENNSSGLISAGGELSIRAQSVAGDVGSRLAAGQLASGGASGEALGSLVVAADQRIRANGQNIARDQLSLNGATIDIADSQTTASNVTMSASAGSVNMANAIVSTPGTLMVNANHHVGQGLINDGAQTTAGMTFPSFFTCNQREPSCYQHLLSFS